MKKPAITIIAALLLIVSNCIYGQTQEELLRLRAKGDRLEQENKAKKAANAELEKQILQGIDKQEQVIMNSEEGDGASYDLKVNAGRSKTAANANTLETTSELSKFELTENMDYVSTSYGRVIISEKGFEAYSTSSSKAASDFNTNLDKYKKAFKECNELFNNYSPDKKSEYEQKNAEYVHYKALIQKSLNDAENGLNTLLRSTNDQRVKGELRRLGKQINDTKQALLDKDPNKTEMLKDFESLKELFKDCSDCGKKQ